MNNCIGYSLVTGLTSHYTPPVDGTRRGLRRVLPHFCNFTVVTGLEAGNVVLNNPKKLIKQWCFYSRGVLTVRETIHAINGLYSRSCSASRFLFVDNGVGNTLKGVSVLYSPAYFTKYYNQRLFLALPVLSEAHGNGLVKRYGKRGVKTACWGSNPLVASLLMLVYWIVPVIRQYITENACRCARVMLACAPLLNGLLLENIVYEYKNHESLTAIYSITRLTDCAKVPAPAF